MEDPQCLVRPPIVGPAVFFRARWPDPSAPLGTLQCRTETRVSPARASLTSSVPVGLLSWARQETMVCDSPAAAARHCTAQSRPFRVPLYVSVSRCSTKVKYGEGSYASNDMAAFGLAATLQHPNGHTRTFSVRIERL